MLPDVPRRVGPVTGLGISRVDFDFKIFASSNVLVIRTSKAGVDKTLKEGEDYTVTWDEDQTASIGGYITLDEFLTDGESVTILSNVAYTQELDLHAEGDFNPNDINVNFDRTEAQIQQLKEKLSRAAVAPASSGMEGEEYGEILLKNSTKSGEYANEAKAALEEAKQQVADVNETADEVNAVFEAVKGVKQETITDIQEFVSEAAFSFRYSENATASSTLASTSITPSTNVKAGDLIMNKSGDVFRINSIATDGTCTLSEKLTSLKGAAGDLTNLPRSDTTLTTEGGYADAKTTGEKLAGKLDFKSEQALEPTEKETAATNLGFWATAISTVFATYDLFKAKIIEIADAYLSGILKELCLENGATQAEIDALENESDS